jgi:hypothetical protein
MGAGHRGYADVCVRDFTDAAPATSARLERTTERSDILDAFGAGT